MEEERGLPGSGQAMFDGRPIEGLSVEDARKELQAIESLDSPLWGEDTSYWERQRLLKRRDALYRQAYPEGVGKTYSSMEDTLRRQGVTKESLERELARIEERDAREAEEKLEEKLVRFFGSEQEADRKVRAAQALVRKYITDPRDIEWIDNSGLGNDLEAVKLLAQLYEIIEGYQRKMPRRKKPERETTELTKGRWRR